MGKFWTDERMERCRKLWVDDGWSAAQVARDLGCTRNSAMSKIHRKGWDQRGATAAVPRPVRPQARRANSQTTNPRAAAARAAVVVLAGPEPAREEAFAAWGGAGKLLLDLGPGECRWPVGDPRATDFCFCASHADSGSYCAGHAQLAYQSVGRRQ